MNKRFLFLLILCQLLVFPATATHRQLLDRDWCFTLGDPEGAGLPGYDDSMWRRLSLPHDWSIEGAPSANEPSGNDGGYLPTGIGWYRKHITLSKRQLSENLHYLYFEGVYERSTVYVNGNPYQGHPYGYSSFYIFLGEDLVVGDNVIAVRADNSHQKNSRWFTGSGIYRHVVGGKAHRGNSRQWHPCYNPRPPYRCCHYHPEKRWMSGQWFAASSSHR